MPGEKRFERWSASYERSLLQRPLFARVHDAIFRAAGGAPVPQAILDVGCGTGRLLREAHRRWPQTELIGVDLSEGMIKQARLLAPYAAFLVSSAEDLPMPSESVDLVVSTMSFHHWNDQAQGIRQIVRVLRPGGRFLLADPAAPRWTRRIGLTLALSASDQRRAFTSSGLAVIGQEPILSRYLTLTIGRKEA